MIIELTLQKEVYDILCLGRTVNSQQQRKNKQQETPQCDETRFSTIQPRIDMTEIRNERWQ